jgi:hypothetical protein
VYDLNVAYSKNINKPYTLLQTAGDLKAARDLKVVEDLKVAGDLKVTRDLFFFNGEMHISPQYCN